MSTAPRDGTIIELRCSYGVAPWYDLYRWTDEIQVEVIGYDTDAEGKWRQRDLGFETSKGTRKKWVSATRPGHSMASEESLHWRPAPAGSPANYVDPTNGAQKTNEYWRNACARPTIWDRVARFFRGGG